MAYEAEIKTDRTARRKSKVTRLGWQVYSILRTGSEHEPYHTEVHTQFYGNKVSFGVRVYAGDLTTPAKDLILLDKVNINELLSGTSTIRRTANGAAAPALIPGEPDLLD